MVCSNFDDSGVVTLNLGAVLLQNGETITKALINAYQIPLTVE